MAQNVTVAGASYSDVPSVTLPKTGGGTAYFTDVTDTTAIASDVASGKYFHLATGERVVGTASGGSMVIRDEQDSHGGTIRSITAGSVVQGTKTITENGIADVTNYASVDVAVPNVSPTLVTKSITANGTYNASSDNADGYSSVTVNVSGGGGSGSGDMSDPIRFFDYNGTLVASYKSVPASLPDVPTHSKLTNGTWNHTLVQISTQFNAIGTCDVGANYDPASGKNEIDVTLDSDRLEPYLCIAVSGTATVDWGDGSSTDTLTGTSFTDLLFLPHTYAQAGDYTISIDGAVGFYGDAQNSAPLLRPSNDTSTDRRYSRAYSNCVTEVRVAAGSQINDYAFCNCHNLTSVSIPYGLTSIGDNAFRYCNSLTSVSIPDSVTSIGNYALYYCPILTSVSIPSGVTSIGYNVFSNCSSLTSVSIPSRVTSIGSNTFNNCYGLTRVSIPDGVTSISSYEFAYCYSLTSVSIPSRVTSIGSYAFRGCSGVLEYHLLPTTPPTLSSNNVFNGIVDGTVIYVPQGCLEAYQTATNWSNYASYMVEE